MAPVGTVTSRDVAEAALTTALVAPKYTTLLVVVVLKADPVIVTADPALPDKGLTEATVTTGFTVKGFTALKEPQMLDTV